MSRGLVLRNSEYVEGLWVRIGKTLQHYMIKVGEGMVEGYCEKVVVRITHRCPVY